MRSCNFQEITFPKVMHFKEEARDLLFARKGNPRFPGECHTSFRSGNPRDDDEIPIFIPTLLVRCTTVDRRTRETDLVPIRIVLREGATNNSEHSKRD